MNDNERIDKFINAMKLKDGTPLISPELIDWLIGQGFFMKPAAIIMEITQVVCLTTA